MNEQKNKWMNEKCEEKNGWNKEQTSWLRKNEGMNEWINNRMNEWMNE